jgi:hypothetical protein
MYRTNDWSNQMANREYIEDRNDIDLSPPAAWDESHDALPVPHRDRFSAQRVTQLAVAAAIYLALLAGLTLHGLEVPDPNPTSSLSNKTTALPAMSEHRRDRE